MSRTSLVDWAAVAKQEASERAAAETRLPDLARELSRRRIEVSWRFVGDFGDFVVVRAVAGHPGAWRDVAIDVMARRRFFMTGEEAAAGAFRFRAYAEAERGGGEVYELGIASPGADLLFAAFAELAADRDPRPLLREAAAAAGRTLEGPATREAAAPAFVAAKRTRLIVADD